jgi:spore coat protein U-like protein
MNPRLVSLSLLFALPFSSHAAEKNSTLLSTSTVDRICNITANPLQFGLYDAVGVQGTQDLKAQSSILLHCTRGSDSVVVSLDQGENAPESSTCVQPVRRMKSGDHYLTYYIFSEANKAWPEQAWGCDSQAVNLGQFESSLEPVRLTTYGLVVKSQNAPQGSYTDTVGVVVTF